MLVMHLMEEGWCLPCLSAALAEYHAADSSNFVLPQGNTQHVDKPAEID